jgi:hypothetical protein
MPAHRKYEAPFDGMVRFLRESRAGGLSFDEAWSAALTTPTLARGIRFPHATSLRREYLDAFEATKPEWAAAYESRETRLSRALEQLAELVIEDSTSSARIGHGRDSQRDGPRPALLLVPLGMPRRSRKLRRTAAQDWPETRELTAA